MNAINDARLLRLALPEVIVVATALIVMAVDLLLLRGCSTRIRFSLVAALGVLGCAVAIVRIVLAPQVGNILRRHAHRQSAHPSGADSCCSL